MAEMNKTDRKWAEVLARLRAGMVREKLPPMPGEVERSLEHAFVAGMVSYRDLVLDVLETIPTADVPGTTSALADLDQDLGESAARCGADMHGKAAR